MRVTLIVPPSGFQIDERVYPMLGVLKVAAALEVAEHRVRVLDLSGVAADDFHGEILAEHEYGESDVYGITATMPQMPAAFAIRDILKSETSSRVILGGAHVTIMNASARLGSHRALAMRHELMEAFDCLVAGDGERAVFRALDSSAPKLIDADVPSSTLFLTAADLAASPWPARHLIDLSSYHCFVDGRPATSVIAQLGCPFRCGFCAGRSSPTFRRVRTRPVEDIVAELIHLDETYGYRAFMFLDDELNVNRSFLDLLRAFRDTQDRRGVEWRLCGLLKSELFTQEQADLMHAAGFRKILVGFESGHPRILDNMQKNATVEDNTRAVEMAHRAGLRIKALMSLGHAGESPETIEATRQWLLAARPDEFDATVLTIYPGTPYHDQAAEFTPGVWTYTAKNGDRLHAGTVDQRVDVPYYKGVPGHYQSFVWTDHLSSDDLVSLRDALERDVRQRLGIPWPADAASVQYEHSMGMSS